MFIANDSNYTFGQFLAVENGNDIKAPVYTKCFTDTEALKGYRFVHDPEETNPEKCVSFSIYNDTDSVALAMPFGKFAAVSDLTSVMFRLDTEFVESVLRDVPYYHVIVPVENITDNTRKYLVIKMTKEVEIFPENYPYYELVDTFADAEPTSEEAPSGGGGEGGGGDELLNNIRFLTVRNATEGARFEVTPLKKQANMFGYDGSIVLLAGQSVQIAALPMYGNEAEIIGHMAQIPFNFLSAAGYPMEYFNPSFTDLSLDGVYTKANSTNCIFNIYIDIEDSNPEITFYAANP